MLNPELPVGRAGRAAFDTTETLAEFTHRRPTTFASAPTSETDTAVNMAACKYPRIVEFRGSLPMTATGKILDRELG